MDREDKRGIFFGVVGVLTLIVAIIGASFAYFSINAKSADNDLKVKAATVQISYIDGENIAINEIIPSTEAIALKAFTRAQGEASEHTQCIDNNNRVVCGVYNFGIKNNATNSISITAKVSPATLGEGEKGFTNLKYIMYDVTDSSQEKEVGRGTLGYDTDISLLTSEQTVEGGNTANYRLFIWLEEAGADNDAEQGAIFNGTVKIEVPGSGNGTITGDVGE